MADQLTDRLSLLSEKLEADNSEHSSALNKTSSPLTGIQRGIEKESLRINSEGRLSDKPHPAGLGSALSHPHITTDFSEALLEFITPVFSDIDESLDFLEQVHKACYDSLDEEELWGSSMPCVIRGEQDIPLAQYGSSNVATMKTAYRRGLGYRYGRTMQTIAGIHYNFSVPDALSLH